MGWTPGEGDDWRKDYSRANERAKRLRRDLTPSEKKLWKILRKLKHEGAHFRKQCQVGEFVYDFAALSHRLLIELDGAAHDWADVQQQDQVKTASAEARGFRVLRIRNEEVNYTAHVIERVRAHLLPPAPSPPPRGGESAPALHGALGARNQASCTDNRPRPAATFTLRSKLIRTRC